MLEIGSPAPDVVLEDTDGRAVRLSGDGRAVLVYFLRSTTCPVCNRHVRDLVRRAGELAAAGVRVLVAAPEDPPVAAAWKARRGIPFGVLAGRDGTPHELLGLRKAAFGSVQRSGTLLVDAKGVVRLARGATLPTGGYDGKAIAAAVKEL
ncbi:peroxiredoxin family protein [Actinomadura sp. ATCC 31491]|uniref:Peroxiredoxin family protein n=1 Tax=Actinomadura luzonensis TaxID=2805427 RepID=A0ABT0FZR9_9ACTN|nr:peroxiredoxin family protein [Actinomadura luzonensis]MCK2217795.1 peroxiredoxin family protein [Actinomadura luzonensis]